MIKFVANLFAFSIITILFSTSVFSADDFTNPTFLRDFSAFGDAPSSLTPQSPTNSTTFGSDQDKIPNPLGGRTNSLQAFFMGIISICIQLGTIVSVLAIMYGGFLYVGAQGNEEQLAKAYKTITWALVGTAVLLGARTIMVAVSDTVTQLGQGI